VKALQDNDKFQTSLYAEKTINKFKNKERSREGEKKTEERRRKITELDAAVGRVVSALEESGELENTIIIFLSDNGARFMETKEPASEYANFPLRGSKGSVYEGGTKVPGFIYSSRIANPGSRYDGMVHFVDILPTILGALKKTDTSDLTGLDGLDQWESITTNLNSKRSLMIYNLDDNFLAPVLNTSKKPNFQVGIREGDYKLIWGQASALHRSYREAKESGGISNDGDVVTELYNLRSDPGETINIAETRPAMVDRLKEQTMRFVKDIVPPRFMGLQTTLQVIDPDLEGGGLTGWCLGVEKTECTSDLSKVSLSFDSRKMFEFYAGSLRNESLVCTSYLE